MPRMNILNAVEQEAFESAPVFNSFQRKQYFDFPHGSAAGAPERHSTHIGSPPRSHAGGEAHVT